MAYPLLWFGWSDDGERPDEPTLARRRRLLSASDDAQNDDTEQAGERDWFAAICRGEEPAFHALYTKYSASLWEFTTYLVRDPDLAGDIVQDVFVSLWTRRATLQVRDGARVYLFRAIRNQVSKHRRHAAVVERGAASVEESMASPVSPELLHATLDVQALEQAIDVIVRAMPPARRTAVTLRLRHGLSDHETAAVMGVSVDAVRMHVSRARAALRPLVERLRDR
jgi:RNA polymerase sigma factor (sigma-70 family)